MKITFFEKRTFACFLCAFFLIVPFFSENYDGTQNDDGFVELDALIVDILFSGLKKTKESYIRPKFEQYLNQKVSEVSVQKIETALQTEGIFDNIQVGFSQTERGACLEISVSEKITFIPLPFATYSSGGFMAGLMVMDTNAFGVKDSFVFGGFASATTFTGMALFKKPAGEKSFGYSVMGSFSKNAPEIKNTDDDILLEYKDIGGSASFSLSRKIAEKQEVKASVSISGNSADEKASFPSSLVESAFFGSFSLSWSISENDYNGWFLSTIGAGISVEQTVRFYTDASESERFSRGASLYAHFQKPFLFDRFRVQAQGAGFWGKHTPLSRFQGGGSARVSLLPSAFKTERIFGGQAGFECALFRFSFGTFTAYADYQIVFADDFTSENAGEKLVFSHGPEAGARLYLSKIAFPALAFGICRNITKEYYQYSFAVGISF